MSFLFKSKASSGPQQPDFQPIYDPYKDTRDKLNTWLSSQVGQKGPAFQGERVAPMTDLEQKSQDLTQKYTEGKPGGLFNAASDEVKKTLSGDYDPSTSPYYQAVKAESEKNLQHTNEMIDNSASGGRRFYSGLKVDEKRKAAQDVNIQLDKTLAGVAQQERQNRLAVLPQAQALETYSQDLPLQQAQAAQALGALPREIQQALLDAIYQEFQQSEVEYPLNIAQLASGPGTQQPTFVQSGFTPRQPAVSSQILRLLSV